jgi:hypothetical protein
MKAPVNIHSPPKKKEPSKNPWFFHKSCRFFEFGNIWNQRIFKRIGPGVQILILKFEKKPKLGVTNKLKYPCITWVLSPNLVCGKCNSHNIGPWPSL